MLKTTVLPPVEITSKNVSRTRTEITVMSYDKRVHQIKVPTSLTSDEVESILVLFTFPRLDNVIQINASIVDGHVQFELPDSLRGVNGEFYIEIDINLTDNRQITFARYRATAIRSDIDSVDLIEDATTFYFELFENFVQQVKDQSQQAVVEITDEANSAILDINAQVTNVDHAKTQALTTIVDDTDEVRQANANALQSITTDKQAVAVAKDNALIAITTDAQSVSDKAMPAQQDIAQAVSDVTDSAQQALGSITADVEIVTDLVMAKQMEIEDATANIVDSVAEFDGLVTDKTDLVNQRYGEFGASVTQANQTIDEILELTDDVQQLGAELNEKANKTQEEWITPTLLNGWYAIRPEEPPQYMKDEFGFVHFRGAISKGASATSNVAFRLPHGYRPNNNTTFSISEVRLSSATIALTITVGGNVDFAGAPLNSWYGISSITFKVV